jgi:hypothetical protein
MRATRVERPREEPTGDAASGVVAHPGDGMTARTGSRSRGAPEGLALGLRVHLGWAAGVALAAGDGALRVVGRRRLELVDPALPESHEPYHAAWRAGGGAGAEALVERGRRAVAAAARRALAAWTRELEGGGGSPRACGILVSSASAPASLAACIASHQRVHVAEGHLYREALAAACPRGMRVRRLPERELWRTGAAELGLAETALRERIESWRRELGAPWTLDQKQAALAAWLALAEPARFVAQRLPSPPG